MAVANIEARFFQMLFIVFTFNASKYANPVTKAVFRRASRGA